MKRIERYAIYFAGIIESIINDLPKRHKRDYLKILCSKIERHQFKPRKKGTKKLSAHNSEIKTLTLPNFRNPEDMATLFLEACNLKYNAVTSNNARDMLIEYLEQLRKV